MRLRGLPRNALLVVVGLVLGAGVFRGENFLEQRLIDLRFFIAANARTEESISDHAAIVLMDAGSEVKLSTPYGVRWRRFHPDLIRQLNGAGASLLVFDSVFVDQDPALDPPFAAAIRQAGNVIAGEERASVTDPALQESFLALGTIRIAQLGGVPRLIRTGTASEGFTPLAALAAGEYARRSGRTAPALPGAGSIWIDFRDPPSYFPAFSYAEVLDPHGGRLRDLSTALSRPLSVLSGKMIFIGRDEGEPSRTDRFPFPNTMGRLYAGVYGHAYAADMLIRASQITRCSRWVDAAATLALLMMLVVVLGIRVRVLRVASLSLLPLAAFLVCQLLLSRMGVWLGFAPMLVGFCSALGLHWVLVRISLAASLSRAVGFDPRLIEAFRRESLPQGGSLRKEVAILIADVRGYTAFVSRSDAGTASLVMREYMAAMERCVTDQGGYVNKYVGDEIVAVFGFPLDSTRKAERAASAGIAMLDELGRITADWRRRRLSSFERIGIGIDAGPVSFTEVGGRTRSQFDIIGDCMNGASRVEQLTKELGRSLLISEEAFRALETGDRLAGRFELIKTVVVRGQGERRIFGLVR